MVKITISLGNTVITHLNMIGVLSSQVYLFLDHAKLIRVEKIKKSCKM